MEEVGLGDIEIFTASPSYEVVHDWSHCEPRPKSMNPGHERGKNAHSCLASGQEGGCAG